MYLFNGQFNFISHEQLLLTSGVDTHIHQHYRQNQFQETRCADAFITKHVLPYCQHILPAHIGACIVYMYVLLHSVTISSQLSALCNLGLMAWFHSQQLPICSMAGTQLEILVIYFVYSVCFQLESYVLRRTTAGT